MKSIAIVGAGFTGAVIAHQLAMSGRRVDLFEVRGHIGGNCHTARDEKTKVLIHTYGPHIFHTSNPKVWNFIRQFDEMMPFTNRVKAIAGGRVYSFPVNLMTINQFFGKTLSPSEAEKFIGSLADGSISDPESFEEQALRFVGKELYQAFFLGYTRKQWGIDPSELPASILKRIPLRFNYDDNYYSSLYQGMPKNGYTPIFEKLLDHPGIHLHLNSEFRREHAHEYGHVFYSGPIDGWFCHSEGHLAYRTLDFVAERHGGDYQGNAVVNYCDSSVPWTRISEHKHFSPWETLSDTIIFKEFSRECSPTDTPYYPVRLVKDKSMLQSYVRLARAESNISFVGRLGTYRYLDMHVAIAEAIDAADVYLHATTRSDSMPAFVVDPLR